MMSNKDIKFTQDSYIGVALKIVDKATQNNPNGVNVIFLDQRQGSIDGRSVNGSFSHDEGRKLKRITNESQIPMISKETVSEPSRQEMDDFEELLEKMPHPRIDNMLLMAFTIAMRNGDNDRDRGLWLGVKRGKFIYYKDKFNLTKILEQEKEL